MTTVSLPIFYDCDGNCNNPSGYTDADGVIICEELVVFGCTDPLNPSYNPDANVSDPRRLLGGRMFAALRLQLRPIS